MRFLFIVIIKHLLYASYYYLYGVLERYKMQLKRELFRDNGDIKQQMPSEWKSPKFIIALGESARLSGGVLYLGFELYLEGKIRLRLS